MLDRRTKNETMAAVVLVSIALMAFSPLAIVKLASLEGGFGWFFTFAGFIAALAVLNTLVYPLLHRLTFRRRMNIAEVNRLLSVWVISLSRLVKAARLAERFWLVWAGVVLLHLTVVYLLGATRSSGESFYLSYALAMFFALTITAHGVRSIVLTTHLRLERVVREYGHAPDTLSPRLSLAWWPLTTGVLLLVAAIAFAWGFF